MRTAGVQKNETIAEQVRARAERETPVSPASAPDEAPVTSENLVPTGATLLNLALSDCPGGGFGLGKMVNLIGDSSSGKTLLCLSMMAEMARDERFDNYRFVFDDAEQALEFDVAKLFGKKLAARIEFPAGPDGQSSTTIQDFQAHVMRALEAGPCVYVLDSFDALTSVEEQDKVRDAIDAREKGREVKGSYGMEKAKAAHQILRMIVSRLKKTASVLLIISQTKDNINPMSFEKKTRSGGHSLRFYATHEVWLTVEQKIKAKERLVGVRTKAQVKKNKLTGKLRTVSFPIYYSYGVDDIDSCIDFLLQEGAWQQAGNSIIGRIGGRDVKATRAKIIAHIEANGLEGDLQQQAGEAWKKIEDSVKLDRKPRYMDMGD